MIRVKICGITSYEDAFKAVDCGADALGFILYPKSKRYIKPNKVREITSKLPPFVLKVGVFVNEDPRNVLEILSYAHLDYAQLHGEESPQICEYIGVNRVIKVFRFKTLSEVEVVESYVGKVRAVLLDTYSKDSYGGTGKTFNWEIAKKVKELFSEVPLILSGGLTPENVVKAIKEVSPYAVDVSSGVEREVGKKDYEKLRNFIKRAKCDNV